MTEVIANPGAVFDLINNETHDESHQINSPEQPPVDNEIHEQEDEVHEHAEQAEQADQGNQEEEEHENLKGKNNLVVEVEEPQTAAYSNAENNETLLPLNSAEVRTELYALHEKVDQVLGRYIIPRHTYELGTLVQPDTVTYEFETSYVKPRTYSMSNTYGGVQQFEFIDGHAGSNYTENLTHYNNPFNTGEERVLRSSVKSTYTTSHIAHERKPSYDVEKLDRIITRIVGAPIRTSHLNTSQYYERQSIRSISPVRESIREPNLNQSLTTKDIFLASGSAALAALGNYAKTFSVTSSPAVRFSANVTSSPAVRFSSNVTPIRESYREVETVKKSGMKKTQQVQKVQQEAYFCGEVENDADSLVMDYMDDAAVEIETKKEQYTNHYVGNLVDDADEAPRTKRVGKRQQIINSRKGQVEKSSEFVKKGAYEQKNKEQVNASQAERYFEKDANRLGDFNFQQK